MLRGWDPAWADTCARMASTPSRSGVLSPKFTELVGLAVNASATNLNAEGTRRHIRGALAAGATRLATRQRGTSWVGFGQPITTGFTM